MPRTSTICSLISLLNFMSVQASPTASTASPIVSLYLPNTDPQPLVGSLIASDASLTTIAIACASGVDDADCGYPVPVTVTAGTSTFHATYSLSPLSLIVDCHGALASPSAVCAETYIAPANVLTETNAASISAALTATGTQIVTTAATATLGADRASSSIPLLAVTITAGATGDVKGSMSASSTVSGTVSKSASASDSGSGASKATGTSTGSAAAASGSNAAGRTSLGLGSGLLGSLGMLAAAL